MIEQIKQKPDIKIRNKDHISSETKSKKGDMNKKKETKNKL